MFLGVQVDGVEKGFMLSQKAFIIDLLLVTEMINSKHFLQQMFKLIFDSVYWFSRLSVHWKTSISEIESVHHVMPTAMGSSIKYTAQVFPALCSNSKRYFHKLIASQFEKTCEKIIPTTEQ